MKTYSNERPNVLLPLNDGNWHYNFNIHIESSARMFDEDPHEQYVYDTVYIEGKPMLTKITSAMKKEGFSYAEIKAEKENIKTAIENAKNGQI